MRINKLLILIIAALIVGFCLSDGSQKIEEAAQSESKNILRFGSVIKLKKEFEERYIILHKHIFPGVLDRIKKSNITNYSIFLLDGVLFSHFEYTGSDFDLDMAAMGDQVTKEWWKLTDPMQEPVENRKEGEMWASMELLYQMDTSKTSFQNAQRLAFVGDINEGQLPEFKKRLTEIDDSFIHLILSANIQNWTVYEKNNRVYYYYEYVGNDIRREIAELENTAGFQAFNNKIEPLFKSSSSDKKQIWKYMKEVFHAD